MDKKQKIKIGIAVVLCLLAVALLVLSIGIFVRGFDFFKPSAVALASCSDHSRDEENWDLGVLYDRYLYNDLTLVNHGSTYSSLTRKASFENGSYIDVMSPISNLGCFNISFIITTGTDINTTQYIMSGLYGVSPSCVLRDGCIFFVVPYQSNWLWWLGEGGGLVVEPNTTYYLEFFCGRSLDNKFYAVSRLNVFCTNTEIECIDEEELNNMEYSNLLVGSTIVLGNNRNSGSSSLLNQPFKGIIDTTFINTDNGSLRSSRDLPMTDENSASYQDVFSLGYNNGRSVGYNSGYSAGHSDGLSVGSQDAKTAYNNGYSAAINDKNTVGELAFSIIDAPINTLRGMFNFEIFGINVSAVLLFILSALLVGVVIKKLL